MPPKDDVLQYTGSLITVAEVYIPSVVSIVPSSVWTPNHIEEPTGHGQSYKGWHRLLAIFNCGVSWSLFTTTAIMLAKIKS